MNTNRASPDTPTCPPFPGATDGMPGQPTLTQHPPPQKTPQETDPNGGGRGGYPGRQGGGTVDGAVRRRRARGRHVVRHILWPSRTCVRRWYGRAMPPWRLGCGVLRDSTGFTGYMLYIAVRGEQDVKNFRLRHVNGKTTTIKRPR